MLSIQEIFFPHISVCSLPSVCTGAALHTSLEGTLKFRSNKAIFPFRAVWKDLSEKKIRLSTCFLRWWLSMEGPMTHTAVISSEFHWSVTVESIHLSVTGMSCCHRWRALAELMMEVFARSPSVCWHVRETKAKASQQWFQTTRYMTAIIKPSLAFSYSHVRPVCVSGPCFGSKGRRDPNANWPLEHIHSDQQTTSIPVQHFSTYWDTVLHICFSLFSK